MKRLVPGLNKLSGDEVSCHPVSVVDMKLGKRGIWRPSTKCSVYQEETFCVRSKGYNEEREDEYIHYIYVRSN